MKNLGLANRPLLLLMVLLAAYEVTVAGKSSQALATWAYTVAFGVLVVAGLVLIILGNEVLEKPAVVIISSAIPLALSLGLVVDFLPDWQTSYTIFVLVGFALIVFSRLQSPHRYRIPLLAFVHAVAGLVIFLLPIIVVLNGTVPQAWFVLISIGAAFIGLAGLLLTLLRSGRQLLSQDVIFSVLPAILLLMTAAFVAGFQVL